MSVHAIQNAALRIAVDSRGAELASIRTGDGAEWLWQGDPAWWTGRAPILFPVVGRSPDDRISIGGRQYPMAQHGFVRRSEFAVVEETATTLRFRHTDTIETRKSYPFAFALDVVFTLEGGTLSNRAEVRNSGPERMPVSLGFHPAFAWPLPGAGGKTHTLALAEHEEPPTYRLGAGGLVVAEPEPSVFHGGMFAPAAEDFARDAVILMELRSRAITFGVEGGPSVAVGFAGMPQLGIWQKPGAPYLCIEPWQGTAAMAGAGDAIEVRPGVVWIEPGDFRTFTMTITPRA